MLWAVSLTVLLPGHFSIASRCLAAVGMMLLEIYRAHCEKLSSTAIFRDNGLCPTRPGSGSSNNRLAMTSPRALLRIRSGAPDACDSCACLIVPLGGTRWGMLK